MGPATLFGTVGGGHLALQSLGEKHLLSTEQFRNREETEGRQKEIFLKVYVYTFYVEKYMFVYLVIIKYLYFFIYIYT